MLYMDKVTGWEGPPENNYNLAFKFLAPSELYKSWCLSVGWKSICILSAYGANRAIQHDANEEDDEEDDEEEDEEDDDWSS